MSALPSATSVDLLDHKTRAFYRNAMRIMQEGGLPFLVGGAYAFAQFTGIERHTKDFDVFIRRQDWPLAEHIFNRAGYETELAFPHWIGKAFQGDEFVDLIYYAGNGISSVYDLWFAHAVPWTRWGLDVGHIPASKINWSKG